MSEKQTKKLKKMASLFYQSQPERKFSPQEIYKQLKQIKKNKSK